VKRRKPPLRSKAIPIAWLLFLIVLLTWLAFRIASGPVINANLLSLLPKAEFDPVVTEAITRVQKRFERRMVWLVGGPDGETARAAAMDVFTQLQESGQFKLLSIRHDRVRARRASAFYLSLRFGLMSNVSRQQLLDGETDTFERSVLRRYFTPQLALNSSLIAKDPLMLLPGFLEERTAQASERPEIEDGFLTIKAGGKVYIFMTGVLFDTPFSFAVHERLVPLMDSLKAMLPGKFPGSELLMAGVMPHAAAGARSAIEEMSNVGLGSILGIVLMLTVIFRSFRPLGLSLTSIAIGVAGGFSACLLVFDQVHLLTLVFGSSLVGISVDYSLHFFCQRFHHPEIWRPDEALRHIFPGITLGLATSVVGFAGLFLAPFQGMREMAVFSSVGLCFAFICVVAWYPHFTLGLKEPRFVVLLNWAREYGELWRRKPDWRVWCVSITLFALAAIGCLQLVARDDVRLLQTPDAAVLAEELRTRDLIGRNLSSQFFLVEGTDTEDFLLREETLTVKLRELQKAGKLKGYLAISDFIPSSQRQQENHELLRPLVAGENGVLARLASQIGIRDETRQAYAAEFERSEQEPAVGLDQWLASPFSEPYRHLWLGASARGVIGVVGLKGVFDLPALHALNEPGSRIHFLDPAGEVSNLFAKYRIQTMWLTLLSYGVVTLILVFRYGLRGGLAVLAAPITAAFASFGVLGLAGEPISLFNIMALLLVLGIGVDYALFFRETGMDHPSTLLAIALSSTTTLLAFGLLAFSSTTAIHAFGLTVLIGILVAFLLSPMAGIADAVRTESADE
jgi:predicted exporter